LGFLQQVIKQYVIRFPFQNITVFGVPPVDRVRPITMREIMTANFRGGGGACAHNNVFLKQQLESIGYHIQQIQGSFLRTSVPLSHNLCLVTIPARLSKGTARKDKNYLLDVGCGIALHELIPLDELPFRGRAGGFDFEYNWVDDTTIQRVHIGGDPVLGPKPLDFINPNNYTIDLKPVTFKDTQRRGELVYRDLTSTFLHRGIYCFRYISIGPDDFQAVCIFGTQLIHFTKETRTVKQYSNYKEMEPLIQEHFPMICPLETGNAVNIFSLPLEEAVKLPSASMETDGAQTTLSSNAC